MISLPSQFLAWLSDYDCSVGLLADESRHVKYACQLSSWYSRLFRQSSNVKKTYTHKYKHTHLKRRCVQKRDRGWVGGGGGGCSQDFKADLYSSQNGHILSGALSLHLDKRSVNALPTSVSRFGTAVRLRAANQTDADSNPPRLFFPPLQMVVVYPHCLVFPPNN